MIHRCTDGRITPVEATRYLHGKLHLPDGGCPSFDISGLRSLEAVREEQESDVPLSVYRLFQEDGILWMAVQDLMLIKRVAAELEAAREVVNAFLYDITR